MGSFAWQTPASASTARAAIPVHFMSVPPSLQRAATTARPRYATGLPDWPPARRGACDARRSGYHRNRAVLLTCFDTGAAQVDCLRQNAEGADASGHRGMFLGIASAC